MEKNKPSIVIFNCALSKVQNAYFDPSFELVMSLMRTDQYKLSCI